MSTARVFTFAGRREVAGHTDLVSLRDLVDALHTSDGAVILDPMSFPWDSIPQESLDRPLVIDVSTCSSQDLIALGEPLRSLTASDAILGDRPMVVRLCSDLGLRNIWFEPDLDVAAFIERSAWAKRGDVEERAIIERLSNDPDLTIVVVTRDMLGEANSDFVALAGHLSESLDGATIDTLWGIHPHPGQPLDRAIVAFRPAPCT